MKQTDGPCPDCGWKFGTPHVCVDLSRPCPGEGVLPTEVKVKRPMSEEQKQKIAESQRRRWATFRRET